MTRIIGAKGLLVVTGLIIAVSAAAGCGGEDATAVSVSLGEWFVRPSQAAFKSGTVTMTVKNDGTIDHQFLVIKTERPPEALVVDQQSYDVDERASGTPVGKLASFGPGHTESVSLAMSKGSYVLLCNLPAHYRQGMRAPFTVQ